MRGESRCARSSIRMYLCCLIPGDIWVRKPRRMLERGWAAGLFQSDLLRELPVEHIALRFHPSFGQPSNELHTMLGVLVLQQMLDLTEGEVVDPRAPEVEAYRKK